MKRALSIYVFLLFILASSCDQQSVLDPEPTEIKRSNGLTIDEVKDFYKKYNSKARTTTEENRIVLWEDNVKYKSARNEDIISVPFVELKGFGVSVDDPTRDKNSFEESYTADVKTELLFRKKETNGIEGYIVHSVRNESAYEGKKNKTVKRDDFDGYTLVYDLEGNHLETAIFKNGKEKYSSLPSKKGKMLSVLTICTTYYSQTCVEGYGCGPVQSSTSCSTVSVPDGSSGSTSISSISVSGSGGGGSASSFAAFESLPGYQVWRDQISNYEVAYYLSKPHLIAVAIKTKELAENFSDYYYCSLGQSDGTNANAFKHIIWNIYNAVIVGKHNAIDMAYWHEYHIANNDGAKMMDEHNNDIGIAVYTQNITSLNSQSLEQKLATLTVSGLYQVIIGNARRLVDNSLVPTDGLERCLN